ncbi:GNAT family N-acetyltransferase, partial [Lutibacter sp.]|uniref:GNAT family N-acetyltransferase n=1 Tax=Lutibacter sp. TaxID=1925666 RepID=UPI003566E57B
MNSSPIFRRATKNDVPQIIKLLATDKLGQLREDYSNPLPQSYYNAFDIINADKNQELMVLESNQDPAVLASFQLTFIPYLSYKGRMRAQIENVMVRDDLRGQGLGQLIFKWAIN